MKGAVQDKFHSKAATLPTSKTVALMSQLFSATGPLLARKTTMCRANPKSQIASMMYQVQCNLPTVTCKPQSDLKGNAEEHIPYSSLLYSPLY